MSDGYTFETVGDGDGVRSMVMMMMMLMADDGKPDGSLSSRVMEMECDARRLVWFGFVRPLTDGLMRCP